MASGGIGAPAGSRNKFAAREIAGHRLRHAHPLELVGVKRLHHQEIQRDRPLAAGLRPHPVRFSTRTTCR